MIYELSLPLSAALARWPGDPPITREIIDNGDVCISRWNLGSHAGTHVDAPWHYHAGVQTVDQLAPESLLGPCRVLHLPDVPCITADILRTQELEGVQRLLFRTRNSRQWQENPSFFDENYVALDCEAARLLVRQGIRLIGVDGLSVEPYGGDGQVHRILLEAGIIIVEGLNLSQPPAGEFYLICAPLRLLNADGAPARVWLTDTW